MLFYKAERMKRIINITMLTLFLVTTILAYPGCSKETDRIVEINWVDFIKFNEITYLRSNQSLPYSEEELEYFAEIQFRVDGNINTTRYQIKDGDAAYVDEGKPIYSIEGYSPEFRLVARVDAELYLFEADTNPNAETGADLLDIGDKVEYIGINSPVDGITELASITEQELVSSLVEMALNAPVDQSFSSRGSRQLVIVFYLSDGTFVKRSFRPDDGLLSRGILLPDEFWEIMQQFIPISI